VKYIPVFEGVTLSKEFGYSITGYNQNNVIKYGYFVWFCRYGIKGVIDEKEFRHISITLAK
tara:strand:+ start:414 stop:596 length:183 start_codon:yes stop_codon:yes gene_type:complete